MKTFGALCIFLAIAMMLIPIISTSQRDKPVSAGNVTTTVYEAPSGTYAPSTEIPAETKPSIQVFLSASKTVSEVDMTEYIVGCVAAEMPAAYHEEALKAQAAACYTNAVRMKAQNNGNAELGGADISDDSSTHQGYMPEEKRRERWGESFEQYEKKVRECVNRIYGTLITFDGAPITAAFHAISSGVTESAAEYWGGDIAYLKSVTSNGDMLSPNYKTTVTMKAEQFMAMMCDAFGDMQFPENASEWITDCQKSEAGTVKSITVNGKTVTGKEMRTAFVLKSAAFTITEKERMITFDVTGYGHGVGMSQYGADFMARQGSTWEDIIKHYYSGVQLTKV